MVRVSGLLERRRHARYLVTIFSKILLKSDEAKNGKEGVVTDLSVSGARLEITEDFKVGETLTILFNCKDKNSFKIKGLVVRKFTATLNTYAYGIVFNKPGHFQKNNIKKCIKASAKQQQDTPNPEKLDHS